MASAVKYLEVQAKSNVKHGGKLYRRGDIFRVSKETATMLARHDAAIVVKPSVESVPKQEAAQPEEKK